MAESRPGVALVATKSLRYATRRLMADDSFSASRRDAKLLVAIGKARYATEVATPEQEANTARLVADVELANLRVQYAAVTGKRPFNGWDAAALLAKIAAD